MRILGLTLFLMLMLSSVCFASLTDVIADNSIKKPNIAVIAYPTMNIRNNKELADLITDKVHEKFNSSNNPSWQYKYFTYGYTSNIPLQEMVEKIIPRSSEFAITGDDLVNFGKQDNDDVVIFVYVRVISGKVDPGFFAFNYKLGMECIVRAINVSEGKYSFFKTLTVRGEGGGEDAALKDGINNIFTLVSTDVDIPLPTIEAK